jgi:hypothetical protein
MEFVPEEEIQTFEYKTIYVMHENPEDTQWMSPSSESPSLVNLLPGARQGYSIYGIYPSVWGDAQDNYRATFMLSKQDPVRAILFNGKATHEEVFFVILGLGVKDAMPWCNVLTRSELKETDMTWLDALSKYTYRSFSNYWDKYAEKTDRVTKRLQPRKSVTAMVKPGPSESKLVAYGVNSLCCAYTLTVQIVEF